MSHSQWLAGSQPGSRFLAYIVIYFMKCISFAPHYNLQRQLRWSSWPFVILLLARARAPVPILGFGSASRPGGRTHSLDIIPSYGGCRLTLKGWVTSTSVQPDFCKIWGDRIQQSLSVRCEVGSRFDLSAEVLSKPLEDRKSDSNDWWDSTCWLSLLYWSCTLCF